MSEYDILLRPTRIKDRWCDVPRITTCGVDKEISSASTLVNLIWTFSMYRI